MGAVHLSGRATHQVPTLPLAHPVVEPVEVVLPLPAARTQLHPRQLHLLEELPVGRLLMGFAVLQAAARADPEVATPGGWDRSGTAARDPGRR